MMKITTVALILPLTALVLLGCGAEEPAGPTPDEIAAQKVQQAMEAGEMDQDTPLEMVEVADEGTVFDPPVQIDQIPDGAWYCDMGTVHYARMTEGDGRCTECGMTLTHKGAHDAEGDEAAATHEG
jgi:hypothetical protein